MGRHRTVWGAASAVVLCTALATTAPAGAHGAPAPGSAAQVARLVAASQRLSKLPSHLTPSLADAVNDDPALIWPQTKAGCGPASSCVFGDTTSATTLVLFGDSHAEMWLAAIIPFADKHHLRILLLVTLACPDADVTPWESSTQSYLTNCATQRQDDIQYIDQLRPRYLVLSERSTGIMSGPASYFTDAQWQAGLETTLVALRPSGANTVVIGDIQAQNRDVPECLATFPTELGKCAVQNPNDRPGRGGHPGAEHAAATAEGDHFVDPTKWLCAKRCSPVIGRMIVYWDAFHMTNTYSAYLSKVLGAKLASAFRLGT